MSIKTIEDHFLDIGIIDQLSDGNTWIHRLDPRAKTIFTLVFSGIVVSFPRYAISSLLPFFLFPVTLAALAELPAAYIVRRTIPALPFAIMVGMFNPWIDAAPAFEIGPIVVSQGWFSFLSIVLRSLLTVSAAMILIAVTGIFPVCQAFMRLGMPRIFSLQIMFLYRYLFVLAAEGVQMTRARRVRSFGQRGMGIRPFASMIASLLVRSLDRAQSIHRAMISRGFNGEIQTLKPLHWKTADTCFLAVSILLCIAFRFFDIPEMVGKLLTG